MDDEPRWLDGYGPIAADYATQIAHDPTGTWRRLVTDPVSGKLLDYGTDRYRPPQHLADHVITRDGHCQFPFCNARARKRRPRPHPELPRRRTTWTSPLGREYTTSPDQRWTLPKTRHAELEDEPATPPDEPTVLETPAEFDRPPRY